MKRIRVVVASAIVGLLVGCAAVTVPDEIRTEAQSEADRATQLQKEQPRLRRVNISDQMYVPELSEAEVMLPSWWFEPSVAYFDKAALSVVLSVTMAGHRVNQRFMDGIDPSMLISVGAKGTVGDVLTAIASASGLSFQPTTGSVTWSRYETAVFDIGSYPGLEQYGVGSAEDGGAQAAAVSTGSGEVTQGEAVRGSGEYTRISGELDALKDIETALKALASKEGVITVSPTTSSVTVRDLPQNVKSMRDFLRDANERVTRQVSIKIELIDVVFEDSTTLAWDVNAVLSDMGKYGINIGTGGSFASALTEGFTMTAEATKGRATGTDVLVKALERYGTVRRSGEHYITASNNKVGSTELVDRESYVVSSTITQTANVGQQASLQQGVVETGTTLYVLPKIGRNRVQLKLSMKQSTLLGIERKEAGELSEGSEGQSIYVESPKVNDKSFVRDITIPSGQTLVVAGFLQKQTIASDAGTASGLGKVLGANMNTQTRTIHTVMVVTPTILVGTKE